VIRSHGEVRCYYPDMKLVRVEPRTFRNAFPSLSPQQQKALADFYDFRKAETMRVAGLDAQAWVFEPKDGLRYGHKFWTDLATGLILKARVVDESNGVLEQFVFSEVTIGAKIDPQMVKPTWPADAGRLEDPAIGTRGGRNRGDGWVVTRIPPGVREDRRRIPARAGLAQGRAPRLFGRPRRRLGVRRAGRARRRPNGFSAQSGTQCLQSARSTTISSPCWVRFPRLRCARSPIPWRAGSSRPAAERFSRQAKRQST
jgi:hypothetical protein